MAQKDMATVVIVEWRTTDEDNNTALDAPKGLAGLLVDDFGDEIDAHVKPLLPPISRLRGAVGITITGDGRPVFLLDVSKIISTALTHK
jgi:chemotaxis protein histidine kinase CheA